MLDDIAKLENDLKFIMLPLADDAALSRAVALDDHLVEQADLLAPLGHPAAGLLADPAAAGVYAAVSRLRGFAAELLREAGLTGSVSARQYWIAQLRWGVTTMRSAGNDKPETVPLFRQTRTPRQGSRQGNAFLAPRAYTAGQGFNVSGPYPGAPTFKPTTPDEARSNVRSLKTQQVDFIKIWMTNPKFPPDVIAAIVDEGKKQGIPVVSHVTDVASLRQLADLGVTDFLHNPIDQPVNPELVAYAKAKKLTFAPTLANIESRWFYYEHPDILRLPILQDALYPRGRQMLADADRKSQTLSGPDFAQRKVRMREQSYPFIKAMSDAGVRVVTGTDCGAEASQVTPFGHATHREIQMFVEAGMSPLAAIRAATLDAARVITRSEDPEYGVIRAGKAADLLLLDADPTVDINNTIRINKVMRAGQWVY